MSSEKVRTAFRCIAAIAFIAAGANHFRNEAFYVRIVPPGFPSPLWLVRISGFFEILGGLGLLIKPVRSAAGWGLIALLIAVFPANIYMAIYPERFEFNRWLLWFRLTLQPVMVAWVWCSSVTKSARQISD